MKIATIGLRGIPAKSGGVEVVIDNLAPELVNLKQEMTVYCRNPYCKKRPKTYKGVKLKYFPTINTKFTETIVHSFLASIDAMFSDYDIVHYHAMGNAMFSFLPRLTGKKTILTLHGLDWQREKWGLLAKLYLKINEKIVTTFPNQTISVSKKIKDYYRTKYKKNIHFIPNGVNIEKLIPSKRFKKDDYILFLSRIVPEKGLHFLIEAFKETKTKKKLIIVGDATHTDDYQKKVKDQAKGDKRIIFTGPLYGKDKQEAFSNAYLFVLPSTIEGMPIVLLEAMSFGLCPLVSDIKENREVFDKFTFKTKDPKDLKKKLEYLLKHPKEVKSIGAECKKEVKAKYNWKNIAKQTLKVYNEVR